MRSALYARVWRWHFFAGLFVAPFACLLALSGAVYLFKPQIESALEARIRAGAHAGAPLDADALVAAALRARSGAQLQKYFLPADADDPLARLQLQAPDGPAQVLWLERSSGRILRESAAEALPMRVVQKLHGELLGGAAGSALVELAACWMIVLIGSGLFLAWPRGRGWRRVLFPALEVRTRLGLRDAHAALGFWFSGIALVFLFSGLPWTGVWGSAFEATYRWADARGGGEHHARAASPWSRSSASSEDRAALRSDERAGREPVTLQAIAEHVAAEQLPPPVEIAPPQGDDGVWTARSMTQRRPDRVTLQYDRWSGAQKQRSGFAQQSAPQRAVGYGIAFHEGQLFGPLNQALGVAVAAGVLGLSISGVATWWRRRPAGALAAPPLPAEQRLARGVAALVLSLALFFPLVGASLLGVALLELAWSRLRPAPAAG